MPTIDVNNTTYDYAEASFGTNRGIRISAPGQAGTTFQLRPNPHKDPDYNKNQPRFYRDLATTIATAAQANGGAFPPDGTVVSVFNVDYTLERR